MHIVRVRVMALSLIQLSLHYPQAGNDFVKMFNEIVHQFDDRGQLSLLTSFKDSPDSALNQIKLRDINIIFGFFGATNARNVLCRVSKYFSLPVQVK